MVKQQKEEVDFSASLSEVWRVLNEKEHDWLLEYKHPLLPAPKSSGSRIAITKGRADLVPGINAAIRSIRLDDTFSKLSRKYFSFDIY